MTTARRTAQATVPTGLAVLVLAACSISPATPFLDAGRPLPTPSAQATTVARADVTGVLTLTGTVTQGAGFQVHATVPGRVLDVGPDAIRIARDGKVADVRAPSGSRITTPLVGVGDDVMPGMVLAEATVPGFSVAMDLGPGDLLRFTTPPLGARAQVTDGPGPFDCTLTDPIPSSPGALGQPSTDSAVAASVVCTIPPDVAVLAGMEATVVIQLEHVQDALVLPVEAVAGTVDSGSVWLARPGEDPVQTSVKLGTTDGTRIVILEGLTDGDQVLIPGPWLASRDG